MKFAAGLLMATIASLSAPALADDYRLVPYDVSGTTTSAIDSSIKANGPGGFAGETLLQPPSYFMDFEEKGGKCSTTNARIETYEITVTMPNWLDETSANACVVTSYRKMYAALLQHEERHVKIFMDAKPALLSAITGVHLPGSCTEATTTKLNAAANKAFLAKQSIAQKQSDDFDKKTKHGVKDNPPVVLDACP